MPKIFHFFSRLLHTIDKTMEENSESRWSDKVSEAEHKRNIPYEKISSSVSGKKTENKD